LRSRLVGILAGLEPIRTLPKSVVEERSSRLLLAPMHRIRVDVFQHGVAVFFRLLMLFLRLLQRALGMREFLVRFEQLRERIKIRDDVDGILVLHINLSLDSPCEAP
jgi:hypothetical protein